MYDNYKDIDMSLIIVGSCSKITQNIIMAAGREKLYKKITISDLLPTYDFHERYYKLRRKLNDEKIQGEVTIDKMTRVDHLYKQIENHKHVLFVTHDYFHSTTSKTKLMEITANFSKNKERVVFATPIEYDHYGFANPEQNYLDAEHKVRQINPNISFLRSDVQDNTELYSYVHSTKKIWQEWLLKTPDSFKPKVVGGAFYAQKVVQALKGDYKGQIVSIRGDKQRHYTEVQHNTQIQQDQTSHQVDNIRLLVSKYRGPQDKHSKLITFKF